MTQEGLLHIKGIQYDSHFAKLLTLSSATVHSVFQNAINLSSGNKLYTVLAEKGIAAPYTADVQCSCAFNQSTYADEVVFITQEKVLRFEKMLIDFEEANLYQWECESVAYDQELVHLSTNNFKEWVKYSGVVNGAISFYRLFFIKENYPVDLIQEAIVSRLIEFTQAFPNQEAIKKTVQHLVGLGTGMTPVCDDFLCGLLLVLHRIENPYANFIKDILVASLNENQVLKRTNDISRQLLQLHLDGESNELYESFVKQLLRGENVDVVLQKLQKVGHSSGIDFAVGAVSGLEILQSCIIHNMGGKNV